MACCGRSAACRRDGRGDGGPDPAAASTSVDGSGLEAAIADPQTRVAAVELALRRLASSCCSLDEREEGDRQSCPFARIARGRLARAAAQAIAILPPNRADEAVDELTVLLESQDNEDQKAASQALAAVPLGGRAGDVIEKIVTRLGLDDFSALDSTQPGTFSEALSAIASKEGADEVIGKLLSLLESPNRYPRWWGRRWR